METIRKTFIHNKGLDNETIKTVTITVEDDKARVHDQRVHNKSSRLSGVRAQKIKEDKGGKFVVTSSQYGGSYKTYIYTTNEGEVI